MALAFPASLCFLFLTSCHLSCLVHSFISGAMHSFWGFHLLSLHSSSSSSSSSFSMYMRFPYSVTFLNYHLTWSTIQISLYMDSGPWAITVPLYSYHSKILPSLQYKRNACNKLAFVTSGELKQPRMQLAPKLLQVLMKKKTWKAAAAAAGASEAFTAWVCAVTSSRVWNGEYILRTCR